MWNRIPTKSVEQFYADILHLLPITVAPHRRHGMNQRSKRHSGCRINNFRCLQQQLLKAVISTTAVSSRRV